MATKNLKKVLNKVYSQNKNFKPYMNPVSWNKAVKYIKAKDARLTFNAVFKPMFAETVATRLAEYKAGGHTLTTQMKKEIIAHVKDETKKAAKDYLASKAAAQQGSTGQEEVQS